MTRKSRKKERAKRKVLGIGTRVTRHDAREQDYPLVPLEDVRVGDVVEFQDACKFSSNSRYVYTVAERPHLTWFLFACFFFVASRGRGKTWKYSQPRAYGKVLCLLLMVHVGQTIRSVDHVHLAAASTVSHEVFLCPTQPCTEFHILV